LLAQPMLIASINRTANSLTTDLKPLTIPP
jgi:hypothetical protein